MAWIILNGSDPKPPSSTRLSQHCTGETFARGFPPLHGEFHHCMGISTFAWGFPPLHGDFHLCTGISTFAWGFPPLHGDFHLCIGISTFAWGFPPLHYCYKSFFFLSQNNWTLFLSFFSKHFNHPQNMCQGPCEHFSFSNHPKLVKTFQNIPERPQWVLKVTNVVQLAWEAKLSYSSLLGSHGIAKKQILDCPESSSIIHSKPPHFQL